MLLFAGFGWLDFDWADFFAVPQLTATLFHLMELHQMKGCVYA